MRVEPKVPVENIAVKIEQLKSGDCFIDTGTLFIITDKPSDPIVIDLMTGEEHEYGDGVYVVPVDCTITWTTKKAKKRKTK